MRAKHKVSLAAVIIVAMIYALCRERYPYPTEQDKLKFRSDCEPIITWLESRHAATGLYPAKLPADLDARLKKINRYSQYRGGPSRENCELWIGSYEKHMWVYYWWSKDKSWNLDR